MSRNTLQNLLPGSKVTIKRNLDHPAWMKEVPADPRNGSDTKRVRDESVEEIIGEGTVHHRAGDRVFIGNGFWYRLDDGFQDASKSTRIEAVVTETNS